MTTNIFASRIALENAIADRRAFEVNNTNADSLEREITAALKQYDAYVCEYLDQLEINMSFINKHTVSTKRFNMKAVTKFAKIMRGIRAHDVGYFDQHTRSIMLQLKHLRDTDNLTKIEVTTETLKAMQTMRCTCDGATKLDKKYRLDYSDGTANTQASSSLQCLRQLGFVKREFRGKNGCDAFEFNFDCDHFAFIFANEDK